MCKGDFMGLAKDYLLRNKYLINELKELEETYLTLKSKYKSIGFSSGGYSDYVTTSPNPDKFTNVLYRVMGAEKKLNKAKRKLKQYQVEAIQRICTLSNENYRCILKFRYFNFMSFNQIAKELKLRVQWTLKLHKDALKEFDNMFYC